MKTIVFSARVRVEVERLAPQIGQELQNTHNIRKVVYNTEDIGESAALNSELLKDVSGSTLVYAIHTRENRTWQLKYIGQTQSKTSRQRIRNHLFKKNYRTGSQLDHLKADVASNIDIGVSYVQIEPPYMRHPVEEILISKFNQQLEWNKQGRS